MLLVVVEGVAEQEVMEVVEEEEGEWDLEEVLVFNAVEVFKAFALVVFIKAVLLLFVLVRRSGDKC